MIAIIHSLSVQPTFNLKKNTEDIFNRIYTYNVWLITTDRLLNDNWLKWKLFKKCWWWWWLTLIFFVNSTFHDIHLFDSKDDDLEHILMMLVWDKVINWYNLSESNQSFVWVGSDGSETTAHAQITVSVFWSICPPDLHLKCVCTQQTLNYWSLGYIF